MQRGDNREMLKKSKALKAVIIISIVLEIILIGIFGINFYSVRQNDQVVFSDTLNRASGEIITAADSDNPALLWNWESLPRGDYSVNIQYDNNKTQHLWLWCEEGVNLKSGTVFLNRHLDEIRLDFTVSHEIHSCRAFVDLDGDTIVFKGYSVRRNGREYARYAFCTFVLFSLFQFAIWTYYKRKALFYGFASVLLISVIAMLPYTVYGLGKGHDLTFHLIRIESLVEELRNGVFPVYLQPLWFSGYGCPVSVYYGDILLYIPAFLRLAGFSVNFSYKFFVFLINCGTCVFSFALFQHLFSSEELAWLLTFAYVCAPYRLTDVFVRAAVGEFCGLMFIPLAFLGMHYIYKFDDSRYKFTGAICLSAGMSGIIASHMLTVIILVSVLACIAICNFRRTFSRYCLPYITLAVFCTCLLSLYFIIPFFDSFLHNETYISDLVTENTAIGIQNAGIQIGYFVSFFQDIFGKGSANLLEDKMELSLGTVLSCAVIIGGAIILKNRKAGTDLRKYTVTALLLLFVSSNIFPWNIFAYYSRLGHALSSIEFPWRYIGIATLFAVLCLGQLLQDYPLSFEITLNNRRRAVSIRCVVMAAILIELLVFHSNYLSVGERTFYRCSAEINQEDVSPSDYVRADTNIENLTYKVTSDNADIEIIDQNAKELVLKCTTYNEAGTVIVPRFNYKGYKATDENGKSFKIFDGPQKEVSFQLPSHYNGKTKVMFDAPWYWKMSFGISAVCSVFLISGVIWNKKSKRRIIGE